jgi:proteasome regulatory subunit
LGGVVYDYAITRLEEENELLKGTVNQLKEELDRVQTSPLMVCEVVSVKGKKATIKLPNGSQFFVEILSGCDKINAGDGVLVEQKNLSVVRKTESTKDFSIEKFVIVEKPEIKWKDVGGLDKQIREMKEIIELPLNKPELFEKVGIQPPKGVLLHGQPGTGKTLLAKAVATSTNSTFIEIVGSELVQKFIGEGAKLVKEIFELAREKAPSIIFIDEIDALASKRVDIGTSGEREVQRTFMQLLSEIDGFNSLGNVKIIGCTNRKDILDTAITRPGRLERHIHFSVPDKISRKEIFRIHSKTMSIGKVDIDKIITQTEGSTGAEIRAVCTEAGYYAIRNNRTSIETKDFLKAIEKVKSEEEISGNKEYVKMFG